ncbi:histone-arginine methyltransferase METTL23 [Condylostylus longicornis]|uniref:histone-arginine methyltransferase METTL23 n=1 Tax=Condylostylus longicornis TaxID=2530218 RepID=UPI00244DA357|nr:histone-arginine methyltransferase METTL23 [Condylostylus longicornis]
MSGIVRPEQHIKKFVFNSKGSEENLEILIPELLQAGYSFYTWPCAPFLAYFLWEKRDCLVDKRVLELGCGTALPGILAAKCGAQVTLTDNCLLPKTLKHIRQCCLANNLSPGRDIDIVGLSWGLLLNSIFNLGPIDLIIASDCFYDPAIFEDILVTVSFLLENNPNSKFICSYQERSADWSIEGLLKKWGLKASNINIDNIGQRSGINFNDLIGGHTIHLLEIVKY